MPQDMANKFERRLARVLAELAILIQLKQSPEGIHAYDLSKKVECLVFEKRQLQIRQIHEVAKVLGKVQKLAGLKLGEASYEELRNELLIEVKNHPLIYAHRIISQILNSVDQNPTNEQKKYLKETIGELTEGIEFLEKRASLWGSISGIYPVLKSLEEKGIVKVIDEVHESGRLRKIYVITPVGLLYATDLLNSFMEVSGFVFRLILEAGIPKVNKKEEINRPFPHLAQRLLNDVDFDKIDQKDFIKTRNDFMPLAGGAVGIGVALMTALIITDSPSFFEQLFQRIEQPERKTVIVRFLKTQFEELQKAINEIIRQLDNI